MARTHRYLLPATIALAVSASPDTSDAAGTAPVVVDNSENKLAAGIAGGVLPSSDFSIDPEGKIRYDDGLHGVVFFGRGTDRVLPISNQITIELDGLGSSGGITGKTAQPDDTSRVYTLPAGEYELTTGDTFTVLLNGFCEGGSPSFADGAITVHCL